MGFCCWNGEGGCSEQPELSEEASRTLGGTHVPLRIETI